MKVINPTKYNKETVEKLEDAFRDGASIGEACDLAQIDRGTYYNWLESVEGFSTKMEDAKDWVNEIARAVVSQNITKKKDVDTAKWWLERRVKDKFSPRQEMTGDQGKPLMYNELTDEQIDARINEIAKNRTNKTE